MKTQLIISIKIFAVFTVLCGVIYPLLITGIAQSVFPGKANGSMIVVDNKVVGSELIGQKFDNASYFQSRPSAIDYNPLPSGGSNLGPTSEKLKEQVLARTEQWTKSNPTASAEKIPSEMLFASASGLDPHISPKAALFQVERIAKARNFDQEKKRRLIALISQIQEKPQLGLLGEARVNVLLLNLSLDKIQ